VHQRLQSLSGVHAKRILMHNIIEGGLPAAFCWTRFGAEAGETFEEILARKDAERRAGGGVFYWGIGSAVGRSLRELVTRVDAPEVLFSPIASNPRACDVNPSHVVRWTEGRGLDGEPVLLPSHASVTSRWDPDRPEIGRFALVCRSDVPLRLCDHGELRFGALRNLLSGAPVGASQVTAVVRQELSQPLSGRPYRVALRASLVWPYLVRLGAPKSVASHNPGQLALAHV
jgi:hypothetical protein